MNGEKTAWDMSQSPIPANQTQVRPELPKVSLSF